MVRTTPDDDHDRKLLADVEGHGWHLVGIDDDPDGPAYVFSVGISHTLQQPEICMFGLSSTKTMGQIINGIGDLMKSGETFDDWHESDDVLDGHSCIFRAVDPNLYREYFGYALWFCEGPHFPMLQCVWPDKNHCYPWDSEFNAQLVQSQPVLALKTAWPFLAAKNSTAITTARILDSGFPVLLVSHDVEGEWQFLCGTTNKTEDGRVASMQYFVENHPSVIELADLPMGWQAVRDGPDQPWKRVRLSE